LSAKDIEDALSRRGIHLPQLAKIVFENPIKSIGKQCVGIIAPAQKKISLDVEVKAKHIEKPKLVKDSKKTKAKTK